jgi:predicted RecA/RadA family phage recombinase
LLQLVASVVARPRRDTASHAAVFYYGAASAVRQHGRSFPGSRANPAERHAQSERCDGTFCRCDCRRDVACRLSSYTGAQCVGRALATLAFYLALLVISLTPPWEAAWDRLSPHFAGGCFSPASWRKSGDANLRPYAYLRTYLEDTLGLKRTAMEESYGAPAERVMVPAPQGGVNQGDLLIIKKLCGVAVSAADEGEEVEIMVEGCFDLPKGDCALALGSPAYWDMAAKRITANAHRNIRIGIAIGDAPREAQIVRVRLDGFIA